MCDADPYSTHVEYIGCLGHAVLACMVVRASSTHEIWGKPEQNRKALSDTRAAAILIIKNWFQRTEFSVKSLRGLQKFKSTYFLRTSFWATAEIFLALFFGVLGVVCFVCVCVQNIQAEANIQLILVCLFVFHCLKACQALTFWKKFSVLGVASGREGGGRNKENLGFFLKG